MVFTSSRAIKFRNRRAVELEQGHVERVAQERVGIEFGVLENPNVSNQHSAKWQGL
jgi:hypothetical protein